MTKYQIRFLGKPEVLVNGKPILTERMLKMKALFYYLVTTGQRENRLDLARFFWETDNPVTALSNLRTAIFYLNRIYPNLFAIDRYGIQYMPQISDWLDVREFESIYAVHHQITDVSNLKNTILLYRGPYLDQVRTDGMPNFGLWQQEQRDNFQRKVYNLMAHVFNFYRADGKIDQALEISSQMLSVRPEDESAWLARMELLRHSGRQDQFIQEFAQFKKQNHEIAANMRVLNNFYHQLLSTPMSLSSRARSHLPRQLKPFFGRAAEQEQIFKCLLDKRHPLITILAPGGFGKTSLSIEVGRACQFHFAQGVHFVNMGNIQPETLELAEKDFFKRIAEVIQLQLDVQSDPAKQIYRAFSEAHSLLILDNVVSNPYVTQAITSLLQNTTSLQILATARERLRINGEIVFSLGGLAYPTREQLNQPNAIETLRALPSLQLLEETARRSCPHFRLDEQTSLGAARICSILGGMPLGIEMAASQLAYQPLESVVELVARDASKLKGDWLNTPGHTHLQTILEDTWQRLSETDRQMAALCALFESGFSLLTLQAISQDANPNLKPLLDLSIFDMIGPERYAIRPVFQNYLQAKYPNLRAYAK